jgi:hypothetical protein
MVQNTGRLRLACESVFTFALTLMTSAGGDGGVSFSYLDEN